MPNFKFELIKLFRTKKIVIAVLVSILISFSLLYWNHTNIDRYGRDLFINISDISQEVRATRTIYNERMIEVGFHPNEIRSHMIFFTDMENEIRAFESINSYEHRYKIPSQMVAFYEAYERYAEDRTANYNGRQFFNLYDGNSERIESEKAFFKELADQGLPYEDPVYTLYGLNFVKNVMNTTWGLALALLIILLVVDIFSGEKVNGTEKVRLVQPVNRLNIFLSKLFVSFIYVLFFLITISIISYLAAGLMGSGFGSINYPVQSSYGFRRVM